MEGRREGMAGSFCGRLDLMQFDLGFTVLQAENTPG